MTVQLFTPFTMRGITMRNRIAVSPMCQYSGVDGRATNWHLVHLGSRAVGGAGLVMVEATAVQARGRISPQDLGLWADEQQQALAPIADFIISQGAVAGIQLAHAGRKASTYSPADGGGPLAPEQGGWTVIGPSPLPFAPGYPLPTAMSQEDIALLIDDFRQAARRSVAAGFQVVEIHSAHGYLLHSFLSPLSNHRTDNYGGSLENRMRLVVEVAEVVRRQLPETLPLWVRISATDWLEGGWDLDQSIVLAKALKQVGVDLIDCSSGALLPQTKIPVAPGYQVPFAAAIKKAAGIATGAVGLIRTPDQAQEIIESSQADLVLLAREMLRDPYWALKAARALGTEVDWPVQYLRARDS